MNQSDVKAFLTRVKEDQLIILTVSEKRGINQSEKEKKTLKHRKIKFKLRKASPLFGSLLISFEHENEDNTVILINYDHIVSLKSINFKT